MEPRINLLTLGVRDMDRAVRFYEQGLKLPRMDSPPEVAFFALNGTWLALYGRGDMARDAGIEDNGVGFGGVSLAHNVASEAAVGAVMDEALAAGATLVKAGHRAVWDGYIGYFADPDGHLWEVAYNPDFWPGPVAATA